MRSDKYHLQFVKLQIEFGKLQTRSGELQMQFVKLQMRSGELQMQFVKLQMRSGELQMQFVNLQIEFEKLQARSGKNQTVIWEIATVAYKGRVATAVLSRWIRLSRSIGLTM